MTPTTGRPLYEPYRRYLEETGQRVDIAWGVSNLLAAAAAVSHFVEDEVLRPEGLSLAGYRVLLALRVAGRSEPRLLASVLFLSRPAVVSSLNTLERAGLVLREPSPTDRRRVIVEVTEAGATLFDRVSPRYYAAQHAIMAPLAASEREALAEITGRVSVVAQWLQEDGGGPLTPPGPPSP